MTTGMLIRWKLRFNLNMTRRRAHVGQPQKSTIKATSVAKNSGGVKKKPIIILTVYFFRFSFNKQRQRLAGAVVSRQFEDSK